MFPWFVLSLIAAFGAGLQAEDPGSEARKGAWIVAQAIVGKMEIGNTGEFPGIVAWKREFQEADPTTMDVDRLVTRNPNWWVAYFEIAPGDPALMLLHCEVLLAGGEAQRAQQLAAIYLQRPGIPKLYREGLLSAVQEATKAQASANALTAEGTKLHDQGNFDGAIAKYDEALKIWPADGWTAYERGFSTYTRALVKAGKPVPKNGTITFNDKTMDGFPEKPEIVSSYARARQHDPLQAIAYQGDKQFLQPLKVLLGKVNPVWDKLRGNVSQSLDDKDLAQLADGFHEAGVHEYALAAREMIIARRRKFAPEDHPILGEHLRALAPAAAIEQTIDLLAGESMEAKVFVLTEPGSEMLAHGPEKK